MRTSSFNAPSVALAAFFVAGIPAFAEDGVSADKEQDIMNLVEEGGRAIGLGTFRGVFGKFRKRAAKI